MKITSVHLTHSACFVFVIWKSHLNKCFWRFSPRQRGLLFWLLCEESFYVTSGACFFLMKLLKSLSVILVLLSPSSSPTPCSHLSSLCIFCLDFYFCNLQCSWASFAARRFNWQGGNRFSKNRSAVCSSNGISIKKN